MAVLYLIGFLSLLGAIQGDPLRNYGLATIEDMRSGSQSRVVAGWEAEPGQFPHQVSLKLARSDNGRISSCGGSVIHHEWIISAAHCMANRLTIVVRLGLTNLTRPEWMVETTQKFIHPGYDEDGASVQTDDIGLIRLEHHIPYGPSIQPIRLQSSLQKNLNYKGAVLTVSGYGRVDDLINGGVASEALRWVYLRGITNTECLLWYPGSTVIKEETLCAEYYNDTAQSSCQGDSGGPLTVVDVDKRITMVGIVSFGSVEGCNSPFPSAYVRPGHYHDWYREVTGMDFDWRYRGADHAQVIAANPRDTPIEEPAIDETIGRNSRA